LGDLSKKNEALAAAVEQLSRDTPVAGATAIDRLDCRAWRGEAIYHAEYGNLGDLRRKAEMGGLPLDQLEAIIALVHG